MLKSESFPAALSTGPKHHFFGYYGINPWSRSMQYHLALETDFHEHRPGLNDIASVGLVDRKTNTFTKYAETSAFNLQQGSMMHWIDVGFGEEFTFNDWENEKLVSRAVHLETGDLRTIEGTNCRRLPDRTFSHRSEFREDGTLPGSRRVRKRLARTKSRPYTQ